MNFLVKIFSGLIPPPSKTLAKNALPEPIHQDLVPQGEAELSKEELCEITDILNQRILKRYAEKGIVFPEDFRPFERLEVGEEASLDWTNSDEMGRGEFDGPAIHLSEPTVISNMPLIVFEDLGQGIDPAQYKEIEAIQAAAIQENSTEKKSYEINNTILIPFYMDEPVVILNGGKKIIISQDVTETFVNAPKDLQKTVNNLGDKYSEDDTLPYLFINLDLDTLGRLHLKISYELEDNNSPQYLENIANNALEYLEHHPDLYAVICAPETLFMEDNNVVKLEDKHTFTSLNDHYKQQKLDIPPPELPQLC